VRFHSQAVRGHLYNRADPAAHMATVDWDGDRQGKPRALIRNITVSQIEKRDMHAIDITSVSQAL